MIVLERDRPHAGPRPGWAHAGGALAPGGAALDGSGREDVRRAVEAVLGRFCWALDERLEGQLASCLAADAVWEGRVEEARELRRREGREAVVGRYVATWRSGVGQLRHLLTETLFEGIDAEWAATRSRLLVTRAAAEGVAVLATGFQITELSRGEGGWAIDRLQVGYDAGWAGEGE